MKTELAVYLASVFLAEHTFYQDSISIEEVVRAYRCRTENRGFSQEDGWNPMENKAIEAEFVKTDVRRSGRIIIWSVVGRDFEEWLGSLFER